MKNLTAFIAVIAATTAFGGFWDAMNKVQRTTATDTAVPEVVNGSAIPASVKVYSDKKKKGL